MTDFWSFLLQTLTASGVGALLLCVKAMFRDKLSPRWQFGVWGVLALILLLPAGWGGRYVLVNWPLWVEALKSALTGQFGTLTKVTAPVPLPPPAPPATVFDWLFLAYVLGVAVLLVLRYAASYVRLRLALRKGRPAQMERVRAVAERYGLPVCPAVEVDGLPTAFICGVLRPVLALPAGRETDEKVILHELLHLKYKDVAWGWGIAFFRCLHWCNPLLWYCADRAGNDLESLCDQRVLERLEGEDRRDYGRILLSMADEKYARTPGTSSAANGGKNIARRIQAIARFKRYPAGMALASVCVALVLAVPLVAGAQADGDCPAVGGTDIIMAYARTTPCTTYAGAFDTYAKAVLTQHFGYRAMCAPLSEQNALAEQGWRLRPADWRWPEVSWKSKVDCSNGYEIYNLTPAGEDAYEGLLVFTLYSPPNGEQWSGVTAERWLAVQKLRAEREGERWVVIPQETIRAVPGDQRMGSNLGLPCRMYEAQYGDWLIQARWQTLASVNSQVQSSNSFWNMTSFDDVPKPRAQFDRGRRQYQFWAVYTGAAEDKGSYASIGLTARPVYGEGDREPRPIDPEYLDTDSSGGSSWGDSFGSHVLDYDWGDRVFLSGGGDGMDWGADGAYLAPASYRAALYLDGKWAAELELLPAEGGEWIEP